MLKKFKKTNEMIPTQKFVRDESQIRDANRKQVSHSTITVCPNCGRKIFCSCHYTFAKDGKRMCRYCVDEYNSKINGK